MLLHTDRLVCKYTNNFHSTTIFKYILYTGYIIIAMALIKIRLDISNLPDIHKLIPCPSKIFNLPPTAPE